MIDFLKNNTWILSVIAILISLVSASFVVTDRIKNWRENTLNKKLKKDKAFLQPLIDLKVENFSSIELKEEKNFKQTVYQPHYSQLYNIVQRINTSSLSNKLLANEIDDLKKLTADDLFEIANVPGGDDFSVQFSLNVYRVISNAKKHLANIS